MQNNGWLKKMLSIYKTTCVITKCFVLYTHETTCAEHAISFHDKKKSSAAGSHGDKFSDYFAEFCIEWVRQEMLLF